MDILGDQEELRNLCQSMLVRYLEVAKGIDAANGKSQSLYSKELLELDETEQVIKKLLTIKEGNAPRFEAAVKG